MSALTGRKRAEAFVELPAPKRVRRDDGEMELPTPLEEGAAGQPLGLNAEGSGSRLTAPEGSVDGKVGSPEVRTASLGPDAIGAGEAMEETLGNTADGPGHERMGADKLVEETLGGTEDEFEDNGTEWVTMVEYMVREAWMNWEQSLREAHRHRRMAQVVTTFGWLLGPEHVGWGLVPAERFSAEEAVRYATWMRLYVSQPEGFEEERMAVDMFGLEG